MSLRFTVALSLLFFSYATVSVHALAYPTTTPSGETTGGTYRTYFDNIFQDLWSDCNLSGRVIGGFDSVWVPICVTPVSSGLFLSGQTSGDTIRFDGTLWVRNNLLYNNGTAIGIGTTSPAYILDVGGTANFIGLRMPTGAGSGRVLTSNAAGAMYWASSISGATASGITGGTQSYIPKFGIWWNGLILSQFFDNGTNIGIGTTIPTAKVDISTVGTAPFQIRSGNGSASYVNNQILFWWNGSDGYRHAIKTRHNGGGLSDNAIDFYVWDQSTDVSTTIGTRRVMTLEGANGGSVGIGTPTISSWARLEVAGQIKITGGAFWSWKVLTSDASGLAAWQLPGAASSVSATGITGGSGYYIPFFWSWWNGLYSSFMYFTWWKLGINTTSPTYMFDVQWDNSIIRAWSGFCLGMTASGCITNWSDLNNMVRSSGTPNYIAKFDTGWLIGNSQLYETGGNLYIWDIPAILWGAATIWYVTIEANGSTNSSNPFLTLSEMWWQECRMWITWANKLGSNCSWNAGGGTYQPNQVIKADTAGSSLTGTNMYNVGQFVGIWTNNPTTTLTIDSGVDDDSGLRFSRVDTSTPLIANGVLALWVNASGKVIPISPISNIAVYNGVDRVTVMSPNPDLSTFNITYDFNRFFAIPGKQSFVVSSGDSSSYNGPYFKENGTSALCSVNGTYGTSPYDCADPDPATGISASPFNSFTMTAKGDTFGYQIALGARWDAPLFARSGRYNGSQTGWLYTNDSPYQTPAPWQKVLSLPAHHPEYLYINTGLSSQLQSQTWWWNVGIGTTTPQSRFEVWTGSTTTALIHFRGVNNVGMGLGASRPQQSGNANSAFGNESLFTLTSGYSNTAIGYRSLRLTAAGFNNSAIGQEALYNNNGWSWNTAVWYQNLYSVTSGTRNIGLGAQALYNLSTWNDNIAIGYQAARVLAGSAISNNIAIWYQSLYSATTSNLLAIGYQALYNNAWGIANQWVGYQALFSNTSGNYNTAEWYEALSANTTGANNTAIGYQALDANSTASNNTAIGYQALLLNTASSNTAVWQLALRSNISWWANTALGLEALYANTTGTSNVAIGLQTMSSNSTGWENVAVWKWAMSSIWSAPQNNTVIGTNAGRWGGTSSSNSSNNVIIGHTAWYAINGGNNNVFLGTNAWSGITTGSNNIVIGNNASLASNTLSNQLSIGNWIYGSGWNIGIATNAPTTNLDINGTIRIRGGAPGAGKILMSDAVWLASWQTPTGAAAIPWAIAGNAGTDPNSNFVGTTDNFALTFRTNNIENMRLLTNGNLGIGTSVPASRLSISWGGFSVGYPTNAAPTDGAIISGNMGIGIISPSEKLTVNGTIENPADNSAIVSGNDRALGFIKKSGLIAQVSTNNVNPIIFSKLSTATITSANVAGWTLTELMRIQNNGDVGIGTAAPWARLDVAGQVRITGGSPGLGKILVSDATGLASWETAATGSFAGWWVLGNAGTTATTNFLGTTDNVDLVIRTNATEKVRIQAGWNVGIGTNNPWEKLDVLGNIRAGTATPNTMMGTHPSYGNTYSAWWKSGLDYSLLTDATHTYLNAPQATWNIHFRTANTDKMFLRGSDGNVGIGNTAPWARLEVTWQVKITGGVPGAGKVLTSDATGLATWVLPTLSFTGGTTNYLTRWTSASTLGIGVTFDNGTNVWINTTSPASRLDVNGNLAVRWDAGGSIYTWNGWDTSWRWGTSNVPWYARFIATGYNQFAIFGAATGNGFSVWDASTGLSAFEVTSSSNAYKSYFRWNVGIWVDPTQSLDVTGQIRIRGGSPWAGKYLASDASGVGTWTTPAGSQTGTYIYRMATPQSSTNTTLAWVTQLTSTPLPVWPYQFEVLGRFQSAAANTGLGLTLAQTSGASTNFMGTMSAQLTNSTMYSESFMVQWTAVTTTGVPLANTDYIVMMRGSFDITATGTVAVRMATENNGTQVILGVWTALIIKSLDPNIAGGGI